ncbi:hypothetical protein BB8028_0004g04280 [Beauveria bassiana]|uniref:Uncharacterized protein n=1 Tax=Beauveria bassiana TaxID=176275 RepID=A0A2S7YBL7_BEABA|nr:hypothetical protein BB8028_0004g04280 [Beauveria bassiana]
MHASRFILTSLIILSKTALGDYYGACILDEAHPPPGTCRYAPDDGIAFDEPCDSAFPCPHPGGDACQVVDHPGAICS